MNRNPRLRWILITVLSSTLVYTKKPVSLIKEKYQSFRLQPFSIPTIVYLLPMNASQKAKCEKPDSSADHPNKKGSIAHHRVRIVP